MPNYEDTPDTPENRTILYGMGIVAAGVVAFAGVLAFFITGSDQTGDKEKTHQVEACASIEEGTAAYACVVEVDD